MCKKLWLLIVVAVVATTMMSCATTESGAGALTTKNSEVYSGAIDAVVWIVAGDSRGTGFLLFPHFIITNKHVVGDHDRVDLFFPAYSHKSNDYIRYRAFYQKNMDTLEELGIHIQGRVIATDKDYDLALILIDPKVERSAPKWGSCDTGQNVHIIGNPSGVVTDSHGNLESWGLWRWEGGRIAQCEEDKVLIETNVYRGNSGGPVLDDKGHVIGVMRRYPYPEEEVFSPDSHMAAFAIPIFRVQGLFDDLLSRMEEVQQIVEVVSFGNRTHFPINYEFRCSDKDRWKHDTVDRGMRNVHWCYHRSLKVMGLELSPSVKFDYDAREKEEYRVQKLESDWQFTVLELFEDEVDADDSREYSFFYDPQTESLYLELVDSQVSKRG